ncbi:MAG: RAMP superfamily CRISPR-associated protein [Candidatus Odinarchaeota archaeon]
MNKITEMETLPERKKQGVVTAFQLPLKITVQEGSFLHIGGSPSPIMDKKAPVFSVDGKPVIPATSFKGAFRYQVEQLLINNRTGIAGKFSLKDEKITKPCIPSPKPSVPEKELLKTVYRRSCNIKTAPRIEVDGGGFCPACYLFGGPGLMGFLRIPNFFPGAGEYRIDQTNIRIDRKTGTAAEGAIVTGEQVKPGTAFTGTLEIIDKLEMFQFGRPRVIGDIKVDQWLDGLTEKPLEDVQLLLINQLLIPALNEIQILGGQKSKGAGKVGIQLIQ